MESLAKQERMKKSEKRSSVSGQKKTASSQVLSQTNSLNELSSKSLLANVLDINDDFGVIPIKQVNFNIHPNGKFRAPATTMTNRSGATRALSPPYNHVQQHHHSSHHFIATRHGERLPSCQNPVSPASDGHADNVCNSCGSNKNEMSMVKRNLHLILKEMRVITQKIKDDEDDEQKAFTWKFAAMVIDRLCMIIFAIANVVSTVGILLTSKNFFKDSNPDPRF